MLRYGAVILAAGGSTRLGEPKQLVRFAGKSLLERIAETALAAGADPVIVVLGAETEKCRAVLAGMKIEILENTGWREGLASSIRLGIAGLPKDIDGAFILLCDQPRVSPDLLTSLIALSAPISASFYGGAPGPPLFFSRRFFPELLLVQGDTGAKAILRQHAAEVAVLNFPGGLQDVDTPADRDRLETWKLAHPDATKCPLFESMAALSGLPDDSPDPSSGLEEVLSHLDPLTRRRFLQQIAGTGLAFALADALVLTSRAQTALPVAAADAPLVRLKINGVMNELKLDPRVTLLDALRETLQLTGSKKGCDHGQCGACTVLVNGQRMNSCLTLACSLEGDEIQTIEGVANGEELHPLQAAFIKHDGFQCGYCTPGQICSGIACIQEGHAKSDDEVREWMSGNLCRCGAYTNIVAAIREVAAV